MSNACLECLVIVNSITTELISLHILPNLGRRHSEGVNVTIVGLSIVEDYITGLNSGTINLLVAHGLRDEAIKFADHGVSSIWFNVPGAEGISNLTEPNLTSNKLWVDSIVGDDVHVIPPTIEKIVVELVMHTHVEDVHGWQMASSSGADHLTVVNNTEVRCAHSAQVLVVLTINKDDLTQPFALAHILFNVLFAGRTCMCADHSHEVIERSRLR